MTVGQFLDRWLDDVRTRVSPKTYERYTQICEKNIAPLLGAIPLAKLRPEQISEAYARALASGRRKGGGGLSPRTVRQMHAILKSGLTQAVKWDILVRNPAAVVRGPKVGRVTMQTYDLEQTAELIEAARGKRVFTPVLFAVLAGLRRGEIAALRWRHVDLVSAQLAVVQSAEQTNAGVRYKEPKSGRGRTIALSDTMVSELKAHRVRQAEELLRFGRHLSDGDFVVTQPDGSPLRPHSLGQEWVRFVTRNSALPRIRFHDLRHAHATHLLSSGVHPKIASERLGHSKVGITLDLYSHVLPNMQADAAAIVDAALIAALNKRGTKG
ncbi:MAG TPA: tyrosine-type recombinase/integrase [Steroidobacteraceae bacterium]|nr:tyrosine-type recombinase/integrase [Steroidobacteraceae bacterium]